MYYYYLVEITLDNVLLCRVLWLHHLDSVCTVRALHELVLMWRRSMNIIMLPVKLIHWGHEHLTLEQWTTQHQRLFSSVCHWVLSQNAWYSLGTLDDLIHTMPSRKSPYYKYREVIRIQFVLSWSIRNSWLDSRRLNEH